VTSITGEKGMFKEDEVRQQQIALENPASREGVVFETEFTWKGDKREAEQAVSGPDLNEDLSAKKFRASS